MRSGYSASRVLVSFLECLLLALIRAWILQLQLSPVLVEEYPA